MTKLTPTPESVSTNAMRLGGREQAPALSDEMPDPDNLRIDRTDLITLPMQVPPAPSIGERLTPPRHRAELRRTAYIRSA